MNSTVQTNDIEVHPIAVHPSAVHPSDLVTGHSVWAVWQSAVFRYADREFLFIPHQATQAYGGADISLTYAAMNDLVLQVMEHYRKAGFGIGHRVALALDNRPDALAHFLALNALGVAIVPLNMDLSAAELGFILSDVECCLAVVLDHHKEAVEAALKGMDIDIPVIRIGDLDSLPKPNVQAEGGPPGPESLAAIIYTSGTTGRPKGCQLTNNYCLTVGEWYARIGGLLTLEGGQERLATPLPLFHINALTFTLITVIRTGNCLIQLDRFHASNWWETLREAQATAFHYLGVMPAILLQKPITENDNFKGRIKFGFGAGVDPKHHATFEKRFGVPLVEGWAMTETGASACIMVHDEPRHVGKRCIGRVPPYMEIRIVDDQGRDVANGESGEFLVRSKGDDPQKGFFNGYFNNIQATDEAWAGGWFHTGDVVYQDAEGSLFFVERKKNIIRRSGENIAAAEVESALLEIDQVANCAVLPVPDTIRGEEVMAIIVPGIVPGSECADKADTAKSIFDQSKDRLAYYKLPAYISFVDELPVTGTQKIQRKELKELATSLLESGRFSDFRSFKRHQK